MLRFLISALLLPTPALAQDKAAIDWPGMTLMAVGGLALFLFGVSLLAAALKELGGGRLHQWLDRSSDTKFKGLASGTVATVALDSSSVTIILLIALVDAGLVAFANALPVVLGANIGTTISSQVFAWSLDRYAPVLLVAGLAWRALAKSDAQRRGGEVVLGIGLVLFGLFTIGEAAAPLKDNPEIVAWLKQLENPLIGLLAGAAVTIAIQSSSAMMGIVITLAGGGLISLPAGVAIMLGAEIGTCADTLIATLGRSRAALRTGLFHLLFNVAAVAVGLLMVEQLAALGAASAGTVAQQIANTHLIFNVAGALIALPFTGIAARALEALLPDRGGPTVAPRPALSGG